jgi:protein tyrosine phosphatase (PTP) superfamily phosphohydrolase (DUF442 family)
MVRVRFFSAAMLILFLASHSSAQKDSAPPMTPSVMSSAYGDKIKIRGVSNPGKINDYLYRGAQPNEQGLEELKKLGITTIVDLRAEDRPKSEWEKKETERLGMHFVHIPIAGFAAPTNEEVVQFLSLVRRHKVVDSRLQHRTGSRKKYSCTACWERTAPACSSRLIG